MSSRQFSATLHPSWTLNQAPSHHFLQSTGRLDEAVEEGRRIVESDPQNMFYRALFGRTLLFARRDDEAIAVLQDVLKADPNRRNAQVQLQQVFARKGMYDQAFAMMQRLAEGNRTLADSVNRAYAEGGFRRAARSAGRLGRSTAAGCVRHRRILRSC